MGKLVGDPYWVHGPLIVGPMAVAKRFAKDFAQVSKALTKYGHEVMAQFVRLTRA